jgi:hypothetical protein
LDWQFSVLAFLLVALLSMSMRGSIKSPSLKIWTRAWISLSIALLIRSDEIVPASI